MEYSFFKGKRVFVTGHTGFKGAWISQLLVFLGAEVTGYALNPPTKPSLFILSGIEKKMNSVVGDIRDKNNLIKIFKKANPEIVIHMAAQPLVRESYRNPAETYEINVLGTVNILECLRLCSGVRSFLNITTDKVYKNNEWEWGYRETDQLGGYDPYSNSKSCSELVTHSYKQSFFTGTEVAISTARAGNVIGGGDFAPERIIPDCVRSAEAKTPIIVRNPHSVRPYQHVLEPLFAYLLIIQKQWDNPECEGWYNVGPNDSDCVSTGVLVDSFCNHWGSGLRWENHYDGGPHEASFLKLDCSLIRSKLDWSPIYSVDEAVSQTVKWTKAYFAKKEMYSEVEKQIEEYIVMLEQKNINFFERVKRNV